ncbi:hypothetical protein MMC26_007207 [Xylographa opegraphella]|nr:hypothetical protein [Xylographa opegraphella]
MGKKRKSGGKSSGDTLHPDFKSSDAKLGINTYEDVADSEDEFHINRDKILLEEGPAQKKQRRYQEEDALLEPSDEEILGDGLDAEDQDGPDDISDEDIIDAGVEAENGGNIRRKLNESDASESVSENNDIDGWGPAKRDYYNADMIETEADAKEEEEEAIRLQKKQLQGMTEADFGFDEASWLGTGKPDANEEGDGNGGTIKEILPQFKITDSMGAAERRKILATRYPEFEPLAQEFLSLQDLHERLALRVSAAKAIQGHVGSFPNGTSKARTNAPNTSTVTIKQSALTAYLATLGMYFTLFTSGTDDDGNAIAKAPLELRDHPIMETLVQCRALWDKVKDLEELDNSADILPLQNVDSDLSLDQQDKTDKPLSNGSSIDRQISTKKRKKRRKTQAQKAAEAALIEADQTRAARLQRTEEDLAKLTALTDYKKMPTQARASSQPALSKGEDNSSDFGEETSLTIEEAAEKARRKKGLRFYTSQIAQKANKRGVAGRDAGGDADLPYRERFKDRVARLNTEAEARGKKKGTSASDVLGGDSDEEDRRVAKEIRDDEGGEEYYDLITARSQEKKSSKAALAAAREAATREGGIVREVEEIGADGKRAITYAIEKNKGLTPKRKKDVRNPRVKKRKKYEDKKKKLSSIRAVYKGGEGRGGYGGELTGIKKGLVRSIKL